MLGPGADGQAPSSRFMASIRYENMMISQTNGLSHHQYQFQYDYCLYSSPPSGQRDKLTGQAAQALATHGATLILLPPRFFLVKEEHHNEYQNEKN